MTFWHTFLSRAPFTTAFLRGFPATEMGETASERGAPDRQNAATMKRGRRKTHHNNPHVGARRTHVHIRKNCTNLVCTRPFDAGKLMSAYARAAYPPIYPKQIDADIAAFTHRRFSERRRENGKSYRKHPEAGRKKLHTHLPSARKTGGRNAVENDEDLKFC